MKTTLVSLILILTSLVTNAQPAEYIKIFHPQTKENITVMKNSPQKIVIAYSQNPETIIGDSAKHINFIKKYNNNGRLVFHHNFMTNSLMKYSYDKKGRVTTYFEELINQKPLLNFAVTYTKKGAITSIKNLDETHQANSISYNSNTKTILISEMGGYIYRYTVDKKNRLVHAKVEYYMSTRYNSTLSYTKKGLLLEEKGSKEKGSDNMAFTTKYLYNKNGLQKKTTTSKSKKTPNEQIKNEVYMYKNSLLNSAEIKDNGNVIHLSYTYDNLQRKIKSTYAKADLLYAAEFYVYR